ncbi:MAG: hypothetical protein KF753_01040 [Caldilineaceae bacterium]|nr:hypothetical protein [Caldilineaceae bacterium]
MELRAEIVSMGNQVEAQLQFALAATVAERVVYPVTGSLKSAQREDE